MPIVFAAPLVGPGTGSGLRLPRRMTWTGADGSVWPLTYPDASNPRMRPGVKGLHMPEMNVYKSSTPLVPGVDVLGYSLPERKAYWPLLFRAGSAAEWELTHRRFFDSFHPVNLGTWTVGEGDDERTLQLRGDFHGDYSFDRDPFVTGWAVIGVELEAPRPLWRGKMIAQTFLAEDPVDFIPDDDGDDYHPSPNATFSSASQPNPGDEPAYITWTIRGPHPADTLSVGVAGADISVPFEVPDGSVLKIDTDPASEYYATLDGVDVTGDLGFQVFAPVPPRGTSPLAIESSGDGSVRAELVPLYWRAF